MATAATTVAMSGCTGSPDLVTTPSGTTAPTATATAATATPSPSASATTPSPTPSAGGQTDQPSEPPQTDPPKTTPATPQLDATASISIATVDPGTGDLVVGGYVTGVFEDGGTCIFTVTPASGGTPLVATTTGAANVDNTSCGSTSFPSDRFGAGTYSVVLKYQNSKGSTESAPTSMKATS